MFQRLTERFTQQLTRRTVAPMDPEAARGRRMLFALAATMYGPPIVAAVVGFGPRSLLAGLFPAACFVGLVRGWQWARTATILSLTVGVLGAVVGVIFAPTTAITAAHRIALAVAAVSWVAALAVLTRSPAIEAYDEFLQDPRPDPPASQVPARGPRQWR